MLKKLGSESNTSFLGQLVNSILSGTDQFAVALRNITDITVNSLLNGLQGGGVLDGILSAIEGLSSSVQRGILTAAVSSLAEFYKGE